MKLETLKRDTPFDWLRASRACRGTLQEERVSSEFSTNRHASCEPMAALSPAESKTCHIFPAMLRRIDRQNVQTFSLSAGSVRVSHSASATLAGCGKTRFIHKPPMESYLLR